MHEDRTVFRERQRLRSVVDVGKLRESRGKIELVRKNARVLGEGCELRVNAGQCSIGVGFRPLHIGRLNGSTVVASETCAFSIIGAKLVREVDPGEILSINHEGVKTLARLPVAPRKAQCVFEFVYFSRPDSQIFGKSVYEVRRELGRQLAREAPG